MSERPRLRELATRLGVFDAYWDLTGVERTTSDATREALVAAMHRDGSSEQAAERALAELDDEARERWIAPVRVWREHAGAEPALRVRRPDGSRPLEAELELVLEDGGRASASALLRPDAGDPWLELPLPERPPPGYHSLELRLALPGGARSFRQSWIVAPRTALRAGERLAGGEAFGIWANLYTVRSARNQGFGDFSDLRTLLEWVARQGGDFVGVNPLHAIRNRGSGIAPYSPVSRLQRNLLYLDVDAVPELAHCPGARTRLAEPGVRALLDRLRRAPSLDYEQVLAWKLPLLRELHASFAARERARDTARGAAYARFLAEQGPALLDFATFCALDQARQTPDWRRWPEELRDPRSRAVEEFRRANAEQVDLHCWLQFELDRQLGAAAQAGRAAGLRIGLYQDLAVGSGADSADTWCFQSQYAWGASLGAPPDAYAAEGQDWGLPPLDPWRLRADGYALWTRLLRSGFRHAGALRIDHVMGLMRQFWIPAGRPGREGTYVRQPVHDLLGVLALESRRHGALVIGEDLGTVPPELGPLLASWGVLSTAVLCFAREADGYRPAARWSPRALATADTHDLPPLVGYFEGRDLELRHKLSPPGDEHALAGARAARARERAQLVGELVRDGHLSADALADPAPEELVRAVHGFLAATPCPLVAVSLDDLAGETEPLNLPGVAVDVHRSWTRRMGATLEGLVRSATVAHTLAGVQPRARRADGAGRPA